MSKRSNVSSKNKARPVNKRKVTGNDPDILKALPSKLSNDEFTHIIHLSDIHIRPVERHDEYKHVFDKLYISIAELKSKNINAIIVITGDIFDNKNRFSPAQYDLCNNFFTSLCNLYPLIVITGNHDMKDTTCIDSITPSAYSRKNFYYLRDSGVYEYGNVVFCVSSLYDEKNLFIKRNQIETNKLCVALYHGTLNGSCNDNGFVFANGDSNRFRSKADFDGFDAVLLGDIHKMQSLAPHIWYSGSLIQQNYGESYRNHGYLLWDISKNKIDVSFREIINEYGMVTLNIENGVWTNNNVELPTKATIRCQVTNTTDSQVEGIINKLKESNNSNDGDDGNSKKDNPESDKNKPINILDWNVICNDVITYNGDASNANNANNTNNANYGSHDDVILKELKQMTGDNMEDIINLHNKYISKIGKKHCDSSGHLWYPTNLRFQNVFGYAGTRENAISFKTGITSITAPNATGKTSIINIILYGLFGDLLYRGTQNIDVLNNKEEKGYIILEICHGITLYTITKELVRRNNNKKNPIVTKTLLTYNYDNKMCKLEGEMAMVKLSELFGTIDDFHKCNILNSRDQGTDFFSLTNGDKIKYLKDVFGLNFFDSLIKMNKDECDVMERQLNILNGERNVLSQDILSLTNNNSLGVDKIKESMCKLDGERKLLISDIKILSEKYDKYNKQLTMNESQIIPIKETIHELENEKKKIMTMYDDFTKQYNINELKTDVMIKKSKLNNDITESKAELLNSIDEMKKYEKNIKVTDIDIKNEESIYKELCKQKAENTHIQKEIKTLENKRDKYDSFNKNIKINDSEENLLKRIEEFKAQYKNTKKNLGKITKADIVKKIRQINAKLNKCIKYDIIDNKERFITERAKLESALETVLSQINLLTKELSTFDIPKLKCDYKLNQIDDEIKKLQSQIVPLFMVPKKVKFNVTVHNNNIKAYNEITHQIDILKSKTVTDDNIDFFISEINNICNRESLPKKVFTETKNNVLIPLTTVLTNIKNNSIDKDRKELIDLSNKHKQLQEKINEGNVIIKENAKIDSIVEENIGIQKENDMINRKIQLYIYYQKLFQLDNMNKNRNEIESKLTKLRNQFEYNELLVELKNNEEILRDLENDLLIDKQIGELTEMINKILFTELTKSIEDKLAVLSKSNDSIEQLKRQYEYIKILKKKCDIENKIKILESNDILLLEISKLNELIEYENAKASLNECIDKIETLKMNNKLTEDNRKLKILIDKTKFRQDDTHRSLTTLETKYNALSENINNITIKTNKINEIQTNISKVESAKSILSSYNRLISPKCLQSVIIKRELKQLEDTINDILSKYTKYKVEILYETDKGIKNGGTLNINVSHDNLGLKPSLLSAFENLILLTAFKRAISRHTNSTRGRLYIMDESLETMDDDNFHNTLPQLLKIILCEYSHIIMISQRDVKHIACNEINIIKRNNISIIE